jgi:hypothetical protein
MPPPPCWTRLDPTMSGPLVPTPTGATVRVWCFNKLCKRLCGLSWQDASEWHGLLIAMHCTNLGWTQGTTARNRQMHDMGHLPPWGIWSSMVLSSSENSVGSEKVELGLMGRGSGGRHCRESLRHTVRLVCRHSGLLSLAMSVLEAVPLY